MALASCSSSSSGGVAARSAGPSPSRPMALVRHHLNRSSSRSSVVARGKILHGDHGHGDHSVKWFEKHKELWTELRGKDDLQAALSGLNDKLLVVDYYASWCAVCKTAYPALTRLADSELKQKYLFAKGSLESAEIKEKVKAEGIKGIPHLAVYDASGAKLFGMGASFKKVDAIKRNLELVSQHRAAVAAAGVQLPLALDEDFTVMIPGVERVAVQQPAA